MTSELLQIVDKASQQFDIPKSDLAVLLYLVITELNKLEEAA